MVGKADSYAMAKIEQLDEKATFRVYGREVDFNLGDAARRWKPVIPCFCVHDTPDNPCPCPKHVWWLRSDMILAQGDAGRQDHDGNDLRYFDVLMESQILIESVQPVNAGRLKELSEQDPAAIKEVTDIPGPGGGGIGTAAGPAGSFGRRAISWLLGELAMEVLLGLSDMPPEREKTKTWTEYCKEHPENPFCRGV